MRLSDIKSVRVIRDSSIQNDGTNSNLALAIDLIRTQHGSDEPLIFTSLMDNVEVLAEKLKFAIENAKSSKVNQRLQSEYTSDGNLFLSLLHFKQHMISFMLYLHLNIKTTIKSRQSSNLLLNLRLPVYPYPKSLLFQADPLIPKRRQQRHVNFLPL